MDVATVRYDKDGDDHYDVISAFIKSMRGSDPDATMHYLARMLRAGEDPRFIARRIMIAASEEVGMAAPQILQVTVAAAQAVSMIGMPEARIILAEAALAVATAPKSNASYNAINSALADVDAGLIGQVPLHLRNAPTALMKVGAIMRGIGTLMIGREPWLRSNTCRTSWQGGNTTIRTIAATSMRSNRDWRKFAKSCMRRTVIGADRFFPPLTSSPISVYNADLVNVNIRSCSTWRASLGKLGRSVEGNDEAMRNMQDESNQRLIMIVDDDQALGEMLSIVLESEGFKTVTCLDGWRAVEMFPTLQPDLMLLDVMLPGLDGVQVAQRIRQNSNTPIIMLTAKSDTTDVVKGLEAGADDYVSKPFEVVELMARIRARLRMPKVNAPAGKDEGDLTERLQCGTLVMDRAEHTATKDGVDLQLTPTEFELLYVLAAHAGEALSRANLLKRVWGYESGGDTRLVNVHVQRLRMKVETDPENPRIVQTVRGIGYKFVAPTV